jgi:tRNA A37 threonylcarbamoyladenosine dehydratase
LAERVRLINPLCKLRLEQEFFTQSSASRLLADPFDWVIDAIDAPVNKCLLLANCRQKGVSVLTVGGAGGKRDATAVRVSDLGQSGHDPLLKVVRRDLRRVHGFPSAPGANMGIPCVFSAEPPIYPWADGSVCQTREQGGALTMDCASGFGAATFVTGVFGFAAAGEVVRRIAEGCRSQREGNTDIA